MVESSTVHFREAKSPTPAQSAVGAGRLEGKRVAMVTFSPYPFDPRPRRAIDTLMSEGATVELICLGNDNDGKKQTADKIRVLRIPLKHDRRGKFAYAYRYGAFILASSVIFAWRCLARRYDLVYVHNMPDILVASALVPRLRGAKVVLDLHDPMPELMRTIFNVPEDSGSVQLLKRLEKWSIGQADLVVTVNAACKKIFSTRSCAAEKIAVVMNSPDGQIFPFHAAQPGRAGKQDSTNPFVIMYHGSLVERNGLDVAIKALALLRDKVPNLELRVFGGRTDFLDRMMNLASEKGVQDLIRYRGPKLLEDLIGEIAECDLGIIPNHRNEFTEINTPTRIFEYLALGKPVVAPSTSGIKDYFDRESLLFFEPGNPSDLARQIEFAASHPQESFEIARRGQQVYEEHTWECERSKLITRIAGIFDK